MTNEDIRRALVNQDFEQAQILIAQWGESVCERMSMADPAEREQIFESAIAEATDNLHLSRVLRSHISRELKDVSIPFMYQDAERERHCWRFSA